MTSLSAQAAEKQLLERALKEAGQFLDAVKPEYEPRIEIDLALPHGVLKAALSLLVLARYGLFDENRGCGMQVHMKGSSCHLKLLRDAV